MTAHMSMSGVYLQKQEQFISGYTIEEDKTPPLPALITCLSSFSKLLDLVSSFPLHDEM